MVESDFFSISINDHSTPTNCNKTMKVYEIWLEKYIWLCPLIICILIPLIGIIPFGYKLFVDNEYPPLQLISDMGSIPAVAAHVSQCLDLIAFFNFITIWIRCEHIEYYRKHYFNNVDDQNLAKKLYRKNRYFYISGLLYSLGLIIVGNFRNTEKPMIHSFGVILSLMIMAMTYFQVQIVEILYSMKKIETKPITLTYCYFIVSISWWICFFSLGISTLQQDTVLKWFDNDLRFNWTSNRPGYYAYSVASVLEFFCMNSSTLLYFSIARRIRLFQK
ncbi:uncharacterized protein LOC124495700 [Dermatophagoides farinae]|uniref:DNA damage-regulated autophagy modulator protein n=1 Tax=Dermatophagoides farinae TaxID=6954 RepID=A0A922I6S3_DERFA|nr:uncharacterized protein LOC124495700 [Dermatophagoides farinae]KAH9526021.1 DNA damage-regulated autophagy modulator protein [Dermatophagoides farinae]